MLNQAVGNEKHISPATTTSGKSAVIGQNTSHDSQSAAVTSGCAIEIPKTLNSLQLLRAWAAFVVVVVHLGGEILYRYGHWPLPKFTQAGGIGVDVFFCLSGFIMYFTSWRNFGASGAVRVFLWRRFLRIYPVYWIVTLMTFLVCLWPESHMNVGNASFSRIIKSVFLLPQDDAPFVGQAWTLVHEIRFYSIFGFFLLFKRANAMWALSVWAATSMCVLVVSYINQPLLDSSLFSRAVTYLCHPCSIEFVLGVFAAYVVCHWRTPIWLDRYTLPVGMVLVSIVMQWFTELTLATKYSNITLFAIPSLLLVFGAALAERRWRPRLPIVGVSLGNASYSTYLIHILVIVPLVWNCLPTSLGPIETSVWACVLTMVVQVIGWFFHVAVESPLHRIASRATSCLSEKPLLSMPWSAQQR